MIRRNFLNCPVRFIAEIWVSLFLLSSIQALKINVLQCFSILQYRGTDLRAIFEMWRYQTYRDGPRQI